MENEGFGQTLTFCLFYPTLSLNLLTCCALTPHARERARVKTHETSAILKRLKIINVFGAIGKDDDDLHPYS